jgi:hypothetical protein
MSLLLNFRQFLLSENIYPTGIIIFAVAIGLSTTSWKNYFLAVSTTIAYFRLRDTICGYYQSVTIPNGVRTSTNDCRTCRVDGREYQCIMIGCALRATCMSKIFHERIGIVGTKFPQKSFIRLGQCRSILLWTTGAHFMSWKWANVAQKSEKYRTKLYSILYCLFHFCINWGRYFAIILANDLHRFALDTSRKLWFCVSVILMVSPFIQIHSMWHASHVLTR